MENDIPMLNAVDIEILMHKQAHFGGSFEVMIGYYARDGVGAMPDFSLKRIKQLAALEENNKTNLAAELIPTAEMEMVEKAQKIYLDLRKVYGTQKPNDIATLISDLILSEEEDPNREINALVKKGAAAVSPLLDLLHSNSFYLPLFPGYGRAPIFAAEALAKIGDPKVIPVLFEALGQENFFTDEAMISAISSFGEAARDFLLKVLRKKPYNKDNEHAAIVLTAMEEDPSVAMTCLEILEQDNPFFAQYLVFGCAGLTSPEAQAKFIELSKNAAYPKHVKEEMLLIIKNWQ